MAKHTDRIGYSRLARCYYEDYKECETDSDKDLYKHFIYTKLRKPIAHRIAKRIRRKRKIIV